MRFSIIAIVAIALIFGGASVRADGDAEGSGYVTVKKGDSLHRLAARHKVSVDDLQRWNRGVIGKNDAIRVGDRLRIVAPGDAKSGNAAPATKADKLATETKNTQPAAEPEKPTGPRRDVWFDHVAVRRGENIGTIARRERVAVEDLLRWNRLTPKSRIHAGDRLIIERAGPKPPAASIGRAGGGSLRHGVWLDRGTGYRLRFPRNAFGTEHVIGVLRRCSRHVHDIFPGTADILIGDISRPGGGRFPPHASHQSGRDADVGYYLVNNEQNATMHVVRPDGVDYRKTWALLRCYLRTGSVVRVYIDRGIQRGMVAWLRAKKVVDDAMLQRLFEVEGGKDALIHHARRHDTHMHVRFACQPGDEACQHESNESPWPAREP